MDNHGGQALFGSLRSKDIQPLEWCCSDRS
jgi:hypothetical protein